MCHQVDETSSKLSFLIIQCIGLSSHSFRHSNCQYFKGRCLLLWRKWWECCNRKFLACLVFVFVLLVPKSGRPSKNLFLSFPTFVHLFVISYLFLRYFYWAHILFWFLFGFWSVCLPVLWVRDHILSLFGVGGKAGAFYKADTQELLLWGNVYWVNVKIL